MKIHKNGMIAQSEFDVCSVFFHVLFFSWPASTILLNHNAARGASPLLSQAVAMQVKQLLHNQLITPWMERIPPETPQLDTSLGICIGICICTCI